MVVQKCDKAIIILYFYRSRTIERSKNHEQSDRGQD